MPDGCQREQLNNWTNFHINTIVLLAHNWILRCSENSYAVFLKNKRSHFHVSPTETNFFCGMKLDTSSIQSMFCFCRNFFKWNSISPKLMCGKLFTSRQGNVCAVKSFHNKFLCVILKSQPHGDSSRSSN